MLNNTLINHCKSLLLAHQRDGRKITSEVTRRGVLPDAVVGFVHPAKDEQRCTSISGVCGGALYGWQMLFG